MTGDLFKLVFKHVVVPMKCNWVQGISDDFARDVARVDLAIF